MVLRRGRTYRDCITKRGWGVSSRLAVITLVIGERMSRLFTEGVSGLLLGNLYPDLFRMKDLLSTESLPGKSVDYDRVYRLFWANLRYWADLVICLLSTTFWKLFFCHCWCILCRLRILRLTKKRGPVLAPFGSSIVVFLVNYGEKWDTFCEK